MKKIIVAVIVCLFLQTSVFAYGIKSTMSKIMESWKGESIDSVIKVWGYPTDEKTIAGRKLFYWTEKSFIYGNENNYGGKELYGSRILEVNSSNRVINWEFQGNDLPRTYLTGKKWVNPKNDPWKKKNKNTSKKKSK